MPDPMLNSKRNFEPNRGQWSGHGSDASKQRPLLYLRRFYVRIIFSVALECQLPPKAISAPSILHLTSRLPRDVDSPDRMGIPNPLAQPRTGTNCPMMIRKG